jgi:DNA-binding transcriptional MerR regulator
MAHTGNPVGNIRDVAQFFGVTTRTVRLWVDTGALRATQMRPRGDLYFDMEELRRTFKDRAAAGIRPYADRQAA